MALTLATTFGTVGPALGPSLWPSVGDLHQREISRGECLHLVRATIARQGCLLSVRTTIPFSRGVLVRFSFSNIGLRERAFRLDEMLHPVAACVFTMVI